MLCRCSIDVRESMTCAVCVVVRCGGRSRKGRSRGRDGVRFFVMFNEQLINGTFRFKNVVFHK